VGAHIGLAKAHNGGELTDPANAPGSITYDVSFSPDGNTLTADIDIGGGWWRFIYQRSGTTGGPSTYDVTFNVDMSDYAGTFTQLYMSGSFNGWCGDCNAMIDAGGGIWKITLPLSAGAIQYKFTMDNWAAQEEFVGGEACTITDGGFTNRYYMVEAGDPSIDLVCWESCEPCVVGIDEMTSSFSIAPNPFNSEIEISSSSSMKHIKVIDMSGKTVESSIANGKYAKLNLEHLISGVYTVIVETSDSISTSRIIKQ
jgi:hypothetical protein